MNKIQIEKEVVSQIVAMYPNSWHYMDKAAMSEYAYQIHEALNQSNLNNKHSIERGLVSVRTLGGSELPSVPVFISWCEK